MTGNSARSRRKSKLEPISLAELAETPGMSGFCTFLTRTADQAVPVLDYRPETRSLDAPTASPTPPVGDTAQAMDSPATAIEDHSASSFPAPLDIPAVSKAATGGSYTGGVDNTPPVVYAGAVVNTAAASEAGLASPAPINKDTTVRRPPLPWRSVGAAGARPIATPPVGKRRPIIDAPVALETPPVLNTPRFQTSSSQIARRFQPLENARVQKAVLAQDGHTMAEQIIYSALYNAGDGVTPCRDVAVGNRWIMARTGLSERTVQLNLKSLQMKLSIEVVQRHNPDTNEPTIFRVYSFESILERRRAAGLDLVARKRGGGVRLVSSHTPGASHTPPVSDSTDASYSPVVSNTSEAPASDTPSPAVSETMHIGNDSGKGRESSSSADPAIVAAVRQYGPVDDEGIRRLVDRCRNVAPDGTPEELVYFIHQKLGAVQLRSSPLAFLMVALPRCLEGESFRQFREQRRRQREAEAARDLQIAREIFRAPDVGAEELQWAREILLQGGEGTD